MNAMPLGCADHIVSRADARRGSAMLRDAILRAKGYTVSEPKRIEVPAFKEPVRKQRRRKRGRPLGWRKALKHHPKVAQIQAVIAMHFGLTVDELLKPCKAYRVARPRQIAMYVSRKTTTVSFPDIGFQFGGKDHTTVVHAVREVEKRLAEGDQDTVRAIVAVREVIGS